MGIFCDYQWFEVVNCCECGTAFGMPSDLNENRLKDRRDFYCPNGHAQYYIGETEEQKLKRQLNRVNNQLGATKQDLNNVTRIYTRMRKRVANGVCPCCNRTFQNLLDHMKTKHPDFGSNKLLRILRESFGLSQSALAEEIGVNNVHISNYERQKPVAGYAAQRIDNWISQQNVA